MVAAENGSDSVSSARMTVHTVDTLYMDRAQMAACYLVTEGNEAAFVEANTVFAWPRLLHALELQGRTVSDVRYLVVTHAHLDHAAGAWKVLQACPNAVLLTHPRAARHLIDPSRLVASAQGVYGDMFERLYGDVRAIPASRVRVMADDETMVWGRRTWRFMHTRGHANHHLVLHDEFENGLFTGDAFGIAYPELQGWVFPSTSPTDFDGEAALAVLDRLVATGPKVAWPTHFGPVYDLGALRDQLAPMLHDSIELVAWMDENLDDEALDAYAQSAVARWFDTEVERRGAPPSSRRLVEMDARLNGQGLAFAVRKRRFKRSKA